MAAIEERTRAYETLIRHNPDGTIAAHHAQITEVLRDGVVISAAVGLPKTVTGELSDVLGESLSTALIQVAQLSEAKQALEGTCAGIQDQLNRSLAKCAEIEARLGSTNPAKTVTRAQAFIALHRVGLLDAVEEYFAAAPMEAKIAWQQAQYFSVDSATLRGAVQELGLSEAQLDDLFALAQAIEV